jgi:hypothetical protein
VKAYHFQLRIKVLILLIPFISIFIINAVCSIQSLFAFDKDYTTVQVLDADEGHAHHNETTGHAHEDYEHDMGGNKDQSEEDGCCNDVTTLFFSNIFSQPDNFIFFHITNQVFVHFDYLDFSQANDIFITSLNPDLLLRQKIPNIRIFIQSFQI